MPEPLPRARHRATRSSTTPLHSLATLAGGLLATTGRRACAAAATSGIALAVIAASVLPQATAQAEDTAEASAVGSAQALVADSSPVVTAPESDWLFDAPDFTVEPAPAPTLVDRDVNASRSQDRASLTGWSVTRAPADLVRYGNGNVPLSALAPVGESGHRMWAPAAAAFVELMAAAAADGVAIKITDSYRSYEEQVAVANAKGIYGRGGVAAVPGTSDHGWGRSVDLDLSSAGQAWMRAHAGAYSFLEDVAGEPWHWTFTPAG